MIQYYRLSLIRSERPLPFFFLNSDHFTTRYLDFILLYTRSCLQENILWILSTLSSHPYPRRITLIEDGNTRFFFRHIAYHNFGWTHFPLWGTAWIRIQNFTPITLFTTILTPNTPYEEKKHTFYGFHGDPKGIFLFF